MGRLAAWGALAAVVVVLTVETGAFRYLRSPFGLAVVAASVGAFLWSRSKKRIADAPPVINQILRIARAHKGRITAAEVLADTTLELEAVTQALDQLAVAGACQLVVGEKGTQVYYFAEFEDAAAKTSDVLSDERPAAANEQKIAPR